MSGDWPTLRSALITAIRANQSKCDTLAYQVGGTLRSDARVVAARRAAVQRVERASGYQDYVRGASPVPKAKTIRRFQRSHDRHGVRCRWAIDDLATLNPKLSTTWVNINAESYKKWRHDRWAESRGDSADFLAQGERTMDRMRLRQGDEGIHHGKVCRDKQGTNGDSADLRSARNQGQRLRDMQARDGAGDHQALDFRGALEDCVDL